MSNLEGTEVAIVAIGRSFSDFVLSRINSYKYDEIWGINSVGAVFHVDRTFMMDPASRFLDGDMAGNQTGLGREFLLETPNKGPIYSCCLDERVPEIDNYPLEEVVKSLGFAYFNNTVAYAVAFAIMKKVSKIYLYGVDFSYKENVHIAESGRGCVEFLCATAISRGIDIQVAPRSPLLDANVPENEKLYGYHRLDDPLIQRIVDNQLVITRSSELSVPEPVDERQYVLIGKEDIEGITYEGKDD